MENVAAGFYLDELRPRFERIKNRHDNGTAPRAVSAFQLFQTPPEIAFRLASLLHLKPGADILEPSAGLGRLLDAAKAFQPGRMVAVEIAPQCAKELFLQERENVQILQRDFLEVSPNETGLFDAVLMNPPFHIRSDIRHILHALNFLKPGGRLAAICMTGPHRTEQLKPLASEWIELPRGSFQDSGTNLSVTLLTIDKK